MSERVDWEAATGRGVEVALRLGDDYEELDCALPAVPRAGDKVTVHGNDPATGDMRVRYYRVREVAWALSEPDAVPGADWPPTIYVYCDAVPSPAKLRISRDELWDTLGIDPDRISREEFDEYMDAYDRAKSAGPVRPDEEPT